MVGHAGDTKLSAIQNMYFSKSPSLWKSWPRSCLSKLLIQSIDHDIEIAVEKRVNQIEKEWGSVQKKYKCLLSGKSRTKN